jgi:steroid delta-isomerase-like uncharacterized protein
MDSEKRKAIVRTYYAELWSGGRYELVRELFDADYVNVDPATPIPDHTVRGPDAMAAFVRSFRDAFPDLMMQVVDQLADGDRVVTRWVASGTHDGSLMGIPPTHRKGHGVEGITISRFRGDRIIEDRAIWDTLGLLRQIGVVPG